MTQTQHTPGPWEADNDSRIRAAIDGYTFAVGIAEMIYGEDDERRANAHLIAAAPELLGALKLAEDFIAGFEGDEMQEGIDERLATIRAAIAKAESGA